MTTLVCKLFMQFLKLCNKIGHTVVNVHLPAVNVILNALRSFFRAVEKIIEGQHLP